MPSSIKLDDIKWGAEDTSVGLLSEDTFFEERSRGTLRPNVLPRPNGVDVWRFATLLGEEIHAARVEDTLYMIADTYVFGYALFRFVSSHDDANTFKASYQRSARPICNERKDLQMSSLSGLSGLAQRYEGRNSAGSVSPMNLGGAPAMPATPAGEGVARGVNIKTLKSEIQMRGYVAGYVMNTAPAVTMSLVRKKAKDGTSTANIIAKESKPTRALAVLMALPANCVQRNGSLASPEDINAGSVDYGSGNKELLKLAFTVPAAIAYLSAFNYRLPEYAPNVIPGRKKQWSPEEIASESEGVSFVYIYAAENHSRNAGVQDKFRFSLKSTSPRKSLYTEGNIMCLRALTHVPVKCTTPEDAYKMNQIAFGAWQYRKKKTEARNALQRACDDCPTQIWEQDYTINGETIKGIGSAFFMSGSSATNAAGEAISLKEVTYIPWWQTGNRREAMGTRLDRLVLRKVRAAEGDRKENMVSEPVLYREDPNDKLFAPYRAFADFVINEGYMTMDKLVALGTRASKAKARSLKLTPGMRDSLDAYIADDNVMSDIQAVQHESSDRAAILAARSANSAR